MSCEVSANNHLHGKGFALEPDSNIRIWSIDHPVGNKIFSSGQIIRRDLIEHTPFVGDRFWKHDIECRDPVTCNHGHQVTEVVHITNLASVKSCLPWKV